jgi:hypothetical protein
VVGDQVVAERAAPEVGAVRGAHNAILEDDTVDFDRREDVS